MIGTVVFTLVRFLKYILISLFEFFTQLFTQKVNETYNVIGNVNEFQVTIGESTFGGLSFGEQVWF